MKGVESTIPEKLDKPILPEESEPVRPNPHLEVKTIKYLVAICWELPFVSGLPNYPGVKNLRFESFELDLPYFPTREIVGKAAMQAGASANFKILAISPLPGW